MSDIKLSVVVSNQSSSAVNAFSLKTLETALTGLESEIRVLEGNEVSPEDVINELTGEYIVWMKSCVLLGEDTLRTLCFFLDEHPETGLTGIRLLDGHGVYRPESKRSFPSSWNRMLNKLGSGRPEAKPVTTGSGEKEGKTELPSACIFLFRRAHWEQVKEVETGYPTCAWEVQLGDRMLKKGFVNYYIPERALCIHKSGSHSKSKHPRLLIIGREASIEQVKPVASGRMPEMEYINGWNLGEHRMMDAICRKNQMKGFTDITFVYPDVRMEQMFLFMEKMPEKKTTYHIYDNTSDETWITTIP
ncbi:MAG: hypothetical protein LIP01_16660 [Tannerellaceae bacterium]|nr:hypothetical protein [Tannerellaceae bacterium]